jgi:hypothetical protein
MVPRARTRKAIITEGGFALPELLIAMFITVAGVLATFGAMDAARALTTISEHKQSGTHVAEQELERLQAMSYDKVALTSMPTTAASDVDPRSRVTAGGGYAAKTGIPAEPLVVDSAGGALATGPEPWTDGRTSGQLFRFVTWVDDPKCGALCPGTHDLKRISVAVTFNGTGVPRKPIFLTSLVEDPRDGPLDGVTDGLLNPLTAPDTQCLVNGQWEECAGSVVGNALTFFPYDTDATVASVRQAIGGNHSLHATVAPINALLCNLLIVVTGCPKPDLMGTTPPPGNADPAVVPALFNYATNVAGSIAGGRVMRQDTSCTGTPSQDNTRSHLWTTPPLTSATTLSGDGGFTFYTQTVGSVPASAKLCVRFYDVPASILNLISFAPTTLGTTSYEASSWPQTPAPVSFSFDFRANDVTVPAGHRIGVRVWADSASNADIAAIYDHPSYPTSVQLTATE